jgi:hypothetical protein
MTNTDEKLSEQNEIEALLPWYAAGTLEPGDMRRVEAWLSEHPDAAQNLALVREEQQAAIAAGEARGAPSAGALDRLMQALPDSPARGASTRAIRGNAAGWLSRLFGGAPGAGYRWAGAAAAVLILVQAAALGIVVTQQGPGGARYQAATGEDAGTAPGTRALVKFSDNATAAEISRFLDTAGVEIVGGPRPGGVYVVRVSPDTLNDAERDAKLKELLAAGKIITFAVPAE